MKNITTFGDVIVVGARNNLNAIRLILALLVIYSHSFQLCLGRAAELKSEPLLKWSLQQQSFGDVSVDLFFFISGLLITASWLHSKTMQDYLWKRILRIYPAFICAMMFSASIVWIFSPEFRASVGYGISWSRAFIDDCFTLNNASLSSPAIFPNNPTPEWANAALWTIQKEFSCYLLVALFGLLALFKRLLVATVGVFLIYSARLYHTGDASANDSRFLTYFMIGMCVWLWRNWIPFSKWMALGCLVVALATVQFKPWFSIVFPIVGNYFILWLGYGPKFLWLDWTRKTDLSYGTYLFAFPLQQLAATPESFRIPWLNFLSVTPLVLGIAWISWVTIEKRFLAMKNDSHVDFDPGAPQILIDGHRNSQNDGINLSPVLRPQNSD